MTNIGTRMAAQRELASLKRSEVARKTGIDRDMLRKYELNLVVPGGDKVARIAQAIGCTTDAILIGDDQDQAELATASGE